jgi:hypothetical protein
MSDRIRTTISLPQNVHEIFKNMADASGVSLSRCMGDWLAETADGAQHVSLQLMRAREASFKGIRELHTSLKNAESMNKITSDSLASTSDRRAAPVGRGALGTPYSNTGLKSPAAAKKGGSKP